MTGELRLGPLVRAELIAHARECSPLECCGVIAARKGLAVKTYRARNASTSDHRFLVHPRDQFEIELDLERFGFDLAAIYHSHPHSKPYPSKTDVAQIRHPDVVHLIIGRDPATWLIRGYRIVDGEITEVELGERREPDVEFTNERRAANG